MKRDGNMSRKPVFIQLFQLSQNRLSRMFLVIHKNTKNVLYSLSKMNATKKQAPHTFKFLRSNMEGGASVKAGGTWKRAWQSRVCIGGLGYPPPENFEI